MSAINEKFLFKSPLLSAVSLFVLISILTQFLIYQRYTIGKDSERDELEREMFAVRERMQTALQYNKSATKTLAFIVKNYGVPEKFDSIAKNLINANKHIDAIQLVPAGIIRHVYPLKGNESVIGYNILQDAARNAEAYSAIEKRDLYFAGPIELKQGGIAVIGRLPIFIGSNFWGFSCVLVKLSTIKNIIEIDSLKTKRFIYEFSKVNPNTNKEEFFFDTGVDTKNENTAVTFVKEGSWNIYVQLINESKINTYILLSLACFIFSFICGYFAWHIVKSPFLLKKLVDEKTEQILVSENNFKTTLERISDAIVAFDKDWRYTFLNNAALLQHPQGRDAVLGKKLLEVHPELMGTIFFEKYEEAVRTNKVIEIDDYYKPMNMWFTVTCYPSNNGLTVFYRDVTAVKIAEREAMHQKNLSESIINSLPGIFYLYSRSGKFIRWNKNVEIMTGYSAEEIGELQLLDFFDESQKKLVKSKIDAAFKAGSSNVEANILTKHKNKIPFYINGYSVNINNEDYLIGIGIDITERKFVEQEKEKATVDLIRKNKNMEQFSYIVSHNLRAPVANILGFIELMKFDNISEQELKSIITGLGLAAYRLDEVVRDLNKILQVKNLLDEKKEIVYFENIVNGIYTSIESMISENDVNLKIDFKNAEKITAIKAYVYSIFYNLILNSIKYRRLGVKAEIRIESTKTFNGIQIKFTDNGLGIDLEKYGNQLFGLYNRFHLHTEGKGFGLFLVKTQLESMGGRISVKSEVNNGTEFIVDFLESEI